MPTSISSKEKSKTVSKSKVPGRTTKSTPVPKLPSIPNHSKPKRLNKSSLDSQVARKLARVTADKSTPTIPLQDQPTVCPKISDEDFIPLPSGQPPSPLLAQSPRLMASLSIKKPWLSCVRNTLLHVMSSRLCLNIWLPPSLFADMLGSIQPISQRIPV